MFKVFVEKKAEKELEDIENKLRKLVLKKAKNTKKDFFLSLI
jgi:mRNA-degrading endonuclease RelE of RelBE toxin-antitoxin system